MRERSPREKLFSQRVSGAKMDLSFSGFIERDFIYLWDYLQRHPEITGVDLSFNWFTNIPENFVARLKREILI